ncbi:PepSY domain-containing protein [Ferrovibrio terrae]|uniref:PepSY domain-containing protein n=1 Tax=Ferrovibrio terrae TaxID=2594003 RepID=A0A516H4I6_9PROT|nr:PepSY-associated TM helix domain-containing protein [Ferrovibrio terrae]QDO98550.1 PepSY domain-containing protein [Ferrovibrio terrae]
MLDGVATRPFWLLVHRIAGLATAGFLFVAGLTGAVIAFHFELDAWLNADIFHVAGEAPPLPLETLVGRVEASEPRATVRYVPLNAKPGESWRLSLRPRTDPQTGQLFNLGYDQIFVDPATGAILERRQRFSDRLDRRHIVGFLYELHYRLHLPGRWGAWLMGGVALIWLFDCFVGAALTLPKARPLLRHWSVSWRIKRPASQRRRYLDLHRVGGLWLWPVLVVLAFTSIYFNLNREVFRPVVSLFSTLTPTPFDQRAALPPGKQPARRLGFAEIAIRAAAETERFGWADRPGGISYNAAYSIYAVHFFPGQSDYGAGSNPPYLYFDAQDGRLLAAEIPGQGTAGDVFLRLQFPLHSGWIAGLAGRVTVAIAGLITAMLSVTGVILWYRRGRKARATPTAGPL